MKNILIYVFFASIVSQNISGQTFGVIGDYGLSGVAEKEVSVLIKNWNPDFIITVGDNNYENGDSTTIDENIGQYFHEYIYPYKGNYGPGAETNRFFPILGNHDIRTANGQPYFDYFTLPGNERYYEFVWGDVHFFALHSDTSEVDGDSSSSIQGRWLKNALALSVSPWNVVYLHESPYTSDKLHSSETRLQWPYKEWGATVVLSGHSHNYERIFKNGLTYIINGLGGKSKKPFESPVEGSLIRYYEDFGAMKVVANRDSIVFRFITRGDSLVDYYSIINPASGIYITPQKEGIRLQNEPNPFESTTVIKFTLPHSGFVRLKVFNQYGKEISTLLAEYLLSGEHQVKWKPDDLQGGIYYYCLFFNDLLEARKAIIIN